MNLNFDVLLFASWSTLTFPKILFPSLLRTYLNILGFGKNGPKKYGESADKPVEWPDCLSFETFKGPNYATIKDELHFGINFSI